MAIYHCSIKIMSRAGGRSAVASAAYRSGEKLYNEETGITHDFTRKGGVIMNEILLPEHVPKEYSNREFLWNDVQRIEQRLDAQYAREVEVALPNEMTREEQINCVREYIKDNFISKGMIADWALHDKNDGNPHAHIMLSVREMDSEAHWMKKQRTVFANARDSSGRPIYNPDLPAYDSKNREETARYRIPKLDEQGNQKVRVRKGKGSEYLWEKITIPANDWNDRKNAEIWRESWANHCNKYLKKENQIDHRSFDRQGIDLEPTIHEGVTARKMAAMGKKSNRCHQNQMIRDRNQRRLQIKEQIQQLVKELTEAITEKARDVYGRFKEFGRNSTYLTKTGRDDGSPGSSAERNRSVTNREQQSIRAERRIHDAKRAITEAEQAITETDQQIERISQLVKQKGADRDERLRKLQERRSASHTLRRDAGSDRESRGAIDPKGRDNLRSTKNDIRDLLRELRRKERASEEKRDHSILEREARDDARKRSDSDRKQRIEEEKRRTGREHRKNKNRCREYDLER